ncbi:hypothetical protein AA313_de0202220 [Arthrobotrys entomopaga]|nr:hypothetical protein AA313_de0202220 [Arthrobotrys entomopaga]
MKPILDDPQSIDSLNVIIPSTPLPWWITSNISKWRHLVSIPGISNSDPAHLAIFDWKILFEISLRQPSSIWSLCPPITLTLSVSRTLHIPILAVIQEVDFVASRAVFRLHRHTREVLCSAHREYISHQRGVISPQHAQRLLAIFRYRLDVLQVCLDARVLVCTDGVYARGDLPGYATHPRADESVVRMLGMVLRENGLRKVILDAFVEVRCSIPGFVFERPGGVLRLGSSGGGDDKKEKEKGAMFPHNELQSLICKSSREYSSTHPGRKHATSSPLHGGSSSRRRCANIVEDQRGGKSRRSSGHVQLQRPTTTTGRIHKSKSPRVSSRSKNKGTTTVRLDVGSEGSNLKATPIDEISRCPKSPLTDASSDSGICLISPDSTTIPTSSSSSTIDTHLPIHQHHHHPEEEGIEVEEEEEGQVPSSTITLEQSTPTPKNPCHTLKQDELKIFNMDSSFAPVTRRQAALALTLKPQFSAKDVKVKRVSLSKTSLQDVVVLPSPSPEQSNLNQHQPQQEEQGEEGEETVVENSNTFIDDDSTIPATSSPPYVTPPNEQTPHSTPPNIHHLRLQPPPPPPEGEEIDDGPFNRFGYTLEEPSVIFEREGIPPSPSSSSENSDEEDQENHHRHSSKSKLKHKTRTKRQRDEEDYSDEEDRVLDSDTPDIELLTDSADEAEHRDRKLRRRERKRRKREMLAREERELEGWIGGGQNVGRLMDIDLGLGIGRWR